MYQFSIVTPTFNRAEYLPRVYDCLCQQGDINFEWIIVDDGSTDNTKGVVYSFEKIFEIKYVYKENAGKPAAMNYGAQIANSHILVSLDDDDMLLPNVLETVWKYFDTKTGRFMHGCVCISGLSQYENGDIIGKKFPHDCFVSDYIRLIKNENILGDKCEFFLTNIYKKYPFPIIKDEKQIAESIMYIRISRTHQTLYVNYVFQEKQFLEDGLSRQNFWLMYPFSSELYYNETSTPPFRLKLQIKHSAKYIFFARINLKRHIYKTAENKAIFPLGVVAYCLFLFKDFIRTFPVTKRFFRRKTYKKYVK